jgi:hypothetical protein
MAVGESSNPGNARSRLGRACHRMPAGHVRTAARRAADGRAGHPQLPVTTSADTVTSRGATSLAARRDRGHAGWSFGCGAAQSRSRIDYRVSLTKHGLHPPSVTVIGNEGRVLRRLGAEKSTHANGANHTGSPRWTWNPRSSPALPAPSSAGRRGRDCRRRRRWAPPPRRSGGPPRRPGRTSRSDHVRPVMLSLIALCPRGRRPIGPAAGWCSPHRAVSRGSRAGCWASRWAGS